MQIPEVLIDAYREEDISETRKVRDYTREQIDTTNPVLIEFYKKDDIYESLEPIIANAIKLDYSANPFINAVKASNQYSHFIVFVKNGDSTVTRYINAVLKAQNLDTVVKNMLENNVTIVECEEVADFESYSQEIPTTEYEDLIASLEIQSTKTTIAYLDEPFTAKCFIFYTSGENDWYPYRYTWNASTSSREEIEVYPDGEKSRILTCTVEFRLKDQPNNRELAKEISTQTRIILADIPAPSDMSVDVVISCPDSGDEFLVDYIYRCTAQLQNVAGGYTDWELSTISWSIPTINDNMYEASFIPTEAKEYTIEATAIYVYKRNRAMTKTFVGTYTKKAVYPSVNGTVSITVDGNPSTAFLGEELHLRAEMINVYNAVHWIIKEFNWTNATPISELNANIATSIIQSEDDYDIGCEIVYALRTDESVTRSFYNKITISPVKLRDMSCNVVIDTEKDTVLINESLDLTARLRDVERDSQWETLEWDWSGVETYEGNTAVFMRDKPGIYHPDVKYRVKDIYGRNKVLEFVGARDILVMYPDVVIGDITISRNPEIANRGDTVDLEAEYELTYEPDKWVVESIDWIGNVQSVTGVPHRCQIIDLEQTEDVLVTITFTHKDYENVTKTLSASIAIHVGH